MKRFFLAFALVFVLLAQPGTPSVHAQGAPTFLFPYTTLQGSYRIKFPRVAAQGNLVSAAGNSNQADAFRWEKTDTAATFSNAMRMGTAEGQPDYATATNVYASDGTLYYAWSNFGARRLLLRVRQPDGSFSPERIITSASGFPADMEIALTTLNGVKTVFALWREGDGSIFYRYSQDDGLTWTAINKLVNADGSTGAQPEVIMFGAPNGKVVVGYTRSGGSKGNLHAYLAIWNGNGFTTERISPDNGSDFGSPSVAVTPEGNYVAVYRGINMNGNFGVYYSERQSDGTWPVARLVRGDVKSVNIVIDTLGNQHIFWAGVTAGFDIFHTSKRPGGDFSAIIRANTGGNVYSSYAAVSLRDRSYGHVVFERFAGDNSVASYAQVGLPVNTINASGISIEGGQDYTNKATVNVSFADVQGEPNQVRYSWGTPPTAASPVLAFNKATPTVAIPAPTITDTNVCPNLTLYTQLLAGTTVQEGVNQDAIIFDKAIQASISLTNPLSGYDPAYTRSLSALLQIGSPNECSGLANAAISGPINPATQNLAINGNEEFSTNLTLTGGAGAKNVNITVTDRASNTTGAVQHTITYDPTAPVVNAAGTLTATPDPTNPVTNIVVNVQIAGANVTEAGKLYGLLVTNSVTPSGGGAAVTGEPFVVPFSSMTSASRTGNTVNLEFDLSVLSGIPLASQVPGTYSFSARYVDGAGNPSTGIAAQQGNIVLSQINKIKVNLPLISK